MKQKGALTVSPAMVIFRTHIIVRYGSVEAAPGTRTPGGGKDPNA